MELLQLEYFITMAECQHMTQAANTLMVSQPSLSNTLSRIEKEMNVKLFDRKGRNIILNNYGKIVLKHAKNIFRELDNIQTEISLLREISNNIITIGSVDSIYVKNWLPYFIKEHPTIFIRHVIGSCASLEKQLLNGEIDFAITDAPIISSSFASQFIGNDEYIILGPLNSIIPNDIPQNFSNFSNESFICSPKIEQILRPIDILSQSVNIQPNITFEGEKTLLMYIFNLGYSHIIAHKSDMTVVDKKKLRNETFKTFYLENECAHLNIHLIWDAKRSLSPAKEILINYLKNDTFQLEAKNKNEYNVLLF